MPALQAIFQAALPLLIQYAPVIFTAFGAWLAHAHVKNALLQKAIDAANSAAGVAVRSVMQTYVDAIVEASKDGALTEAEKGEALRRAISAVLALIPGPFRVVLEKVYPGAAMNTFLGHQIEAAVREANTEAARAFATVPGLSRVPG